MKINWLSRLSRAAQAGLALMAADKGVEEAAKYANHLLQLPLARARMARTRRHGVSSKTLGRMRGRSTRRARNGWVKATGPGSYAAYDARVAELIKAGHPRPANQALREFRI